MEVWRQKVAACDVVAVRYADDLVVGFEHRHEAERFLAEFQERSARFGLELHPDKTRLIEFGRRALEDRRARGEGKPETFSFLGFTHMCGTNSRGYFTIWRHAVRTRLEAKLQEVTQQLRARMHEPVPVVGKWLGEVMREYFQYHAVPGNRRALDRFGERIRLYWRLALMRRSQTGRVRVVRYAQLFAKWLPKPRVLHPYPADRFDAQYSR